MSAKLYLARHGIVRDHIKRRNPSSIDMKTIRASWNKGTASPCSTESVCVSCGSP